RDGHVTGVQTCALPISVRCWGDNNFGQLGNGSRIGAIATTPSAAVTEITTATDVTSGAEHTCALLQGAGVQCWGENGDGRLGNEIGRASCRERGEMAGG